jgi:AmiR/NasT family two-component response regulator
MLLDMLTRPTPRLLLSEAEAASAFSIDRSTESPLRLVDVSSPIVNSKATTRRLGRKSAAIGGRAYVLHPEAETRSQFETVLRALGLSAVDFEDEAELLEALDRERPEVILWGMPGCTPRDLDQLHALTLERKFPVVVVASLGDEVTSDDVQDAGACDLLTLPLPCHRLAPALSIALLRHEILEALQEEHGDKENRRAARSLVWRAGKVWSKRRGLGEVEALRNIIFRSRARGQNLTRTAMEVVAEGLFP